MANECTNAKDIEYAVEQKIKEILTYIGENSEREGLLDTPKRIRKSWNELFCGYTMNPEEILNIQFTVEECEMIILKNCEFYSTCEHHFLPFFGKISIGYIPNKKVVGISKLARLIEIFSRRLQIQERMTTEIANSIMTYLNPQGVMVVVEATHLCMISRGIAKQHSSMVTSAVRGVFKDKNEAKEEFLQLIK